MRILTVLLVLAGLWTAAAPPRAVSAQEERRGIVIHTAGTEIQYTDWNGSAYEPLSIMRSEIPLAWLATFQQPPRFDLLFTSSITDLEHCRYQGGFTLIRQRLAVQVTLTDLATNQVLVEHTLQGRDPGACGDTESFGGPVAYRYGEFDDTAVRAWLITALAPYMTVPGMRYMLYDADYFTGAQYSPDGRTLLAPVGREVRLYDASSGQVLRRFTRHLDSVTDAAFSPDGSRVVSASGDGTVWVWDAATVTSLLFLDHPGDPSFRYVGVEYGPDGRTITTWREGDVRGWNAETGEQLYQKPLSVENPTYSPDGSQIALVQSYPPLLVLDAWTGEERFQIPGQLIMGAIYSHSGQRLLVVPSGEVWDTDQGKLLFTLSVPTAGNYVTAPQVAAFSPDDHQIITTSTYKGLKLWDAATGSDLTWSDAQYSEQVREVTFSPDGSVIAAAEKYWDEEYSATFIRLHDAATGRVLLDLGPGDEGARLAFSPDGQQFMINDGLITVWDIHPTAAPAASPNGGSSSGVACRVSAATNVNLQDGPGTDYAVVGTLQAGTSADADRQATSSDGRVWWRLGDDRWVRSDVVSALGDCAALPAG